MPLIAGNVSSYRVIKANSMPRVVSFCWHVSDAAHGVEIRPTC